MLRLDLLGDLRLTAGSDAGSVALQPGMGRLLACLCLAESSLLVPESLVERLWQGSGLQEGRACLHTALWRLRQVLRRRGVEWRGAVVRGGSSMIERPPITVDAILFRRAAETGLVAGRGLAGTAAARALEEAAKLYTGDLMPGVYDDWALAERERLRELFLDVQLALLDRHAARGDHRRAIAYGWAVLRLEPLREDVHRRVIELHLAADEPGAAVAQFERCAALLARELQVRPSILTTRLVAGLRETGGAGRTAMGNLSR